MNKVKQVSKPIKDFIQEFDLGHPVKGVCFEAKIFIFGDKPTIELVSEVHIITISAKELDIIYILNPELSSKGFPDMFEAKGAEILFREKKGLLIKGDNAKHDNFIILIQPNGKDCEEPSYDQMRAEMNN
jgi:hypothetical protein